MTPRRALIFAVLAIFGTLATAYGTGHRVPYRTFFWAAGVDVTFKPYLPFADFDEVLSAIECHRIGVDVFVADPCDPLGRPHAYSPLWLAGSLTNLGQGDLNWVGALLVLGFLATAIGISAPSSYGEAGIVLLALLSQSCLFAMERANIDLVMFLLVVGGAVLFGRGGPGRIVAYAAIFLAALLKFYPALGLILALFERPRRFIAISATSIAAGASFVAFEWHAFQAIWQHIPRPGPFGDAFGGINFFEGLSASLSVVAPHWAVPYARVVPVVLYVVAFSAAVTTGVLRAPRMATAMGGPKPMTAHTAVFVAGGFILVGAFFLGQNVAYRGIWLLTILPSLLYFRRRSPVGSAHRGFWSATVVLLLLLLWCECFHAHIGDFAGARAARAFTILIREPLWWTFIIGLIAMLWAQLTVIAPMTTLMAIKSPGVSVDLTGSFCTKRFDRNKLGKELCDAEEEVQPGADCDAAATD